MASRLVLDGTCARKQGPRREGGEGGQNGDGGEPSSWGRRAAIHDGIRGAKMASGGGVGARLWGAPLETRKVDRPEAAAPAKQQAGEVDEWGKAGLERVQAGEVLG